MTIISITNEKNIEEMKETLKSLGNKQAVNLYAYIEQLQQELQRKDNIIKAIEEELSDDNKFELFYADENINTFMTLGAKYYREYILDKIKELENGN
jgi:hypothetical protein